MCVCVCLCVRSSLESAVRFGVGLGALLGVSLRGLVVEVRGGPRVLLIRVVLHHLKLRLDGADLCVRTEVVGGERCILNNAAGRLQACRKVLVSSHGLEPLCVGPTHNQLLRKCQLPVQTLDGPLCLLFGVEVDKAVSPGLALQWPRLVEQEVKLLHLAKLLQELHQVVLCDFGVDVSNPQTVSLVGRTVRQDGGILQGL